MHQFLQFCCCCCCCCWPACVNDLGGRSYANVTRPAGLFVSSRSSFSLSNFFHPFSFFLLFLNLIIYFFFFFNFLIAFQNSFRGEVRKKRVSFAMVQFASTSVRKKLDRCTARVVIVREWYARPLRLQNGSTHKPKETDRQLPVCLFAVISLSLSCLILLFFPLFLIRPYSATRRAITCLTAHTRSNRQVKSGVYTCHLGDAKKIKNAESNKGISNERRRK